MKAKFVIADIDGCLTAGRGELIDLSVFDQIRALEPKDRADAQEPWIALITGRPQPYLEGILQLIGMNTIGLFEWGCGLFVPRGYRCVYHPVITTAFHEKVTLIKAALTRHMRENNIGFVQPGKEIAITVYPHNQDGNTVPELYTTVLEWLKCQSNVYNDLTVYQNRTFVYLMPRHVDKRVGLEWMLNQLGIPSAQCLGIGDSEDDLAFLSICGKSAAPHNAMLTVKEQVGYCSSYSYGHGVLDCIQQYLSYDYEE